MINGAAAMDLVTARNGKCVVLNKKTGKLKLVKNYLNNILHGEFIYYWDNGNVRFRGEFIYSRRIGSWKGFDPNGELIHEESY
jgi:antitoxin component YwqK of YwqJK toxin-antitoxin module